MVRIAQHEIHTISTEQMTIGPRLCQPDLIGVLWLEARQIIKDLLSGVEMMMSTYIYGSMNGVRVMMGKYIYIYIYILADNWCKGVGGYIIEDLMVGVKKTMGI